MLGELSEFGHFGQHGGGDHWADAWYGIQTLGLAIQLRVLGDQRGDGFVALFDLFFEGFAELPHLAKAEGIGVMLGMVALGDEQLDELAATLGQVGQLLLLGRGGGGGGGLEVCAVFGQHGGVNGIGLGALALGAGEVTDTPGFDNADRNACRLQGAHDRLFVTAGGFADDMGVGMRAQAFQQLGMALGVIGQGVETAGEMQLQRELGNIKADVEDVKVVLTHTCRM